MRIAGDDEQCVVPMLVGIVVDEWVSQYGSVYEWV